MKLVKHTLLILSLALLVPAASGGTFSINAWTNDASSGIVAGQSVWAYHFGVTNIATVNGVTVPGVGTNGNPSVAGQFSVAGIPFVFLNDNNNLTALGGSGSAVMAKSFLYGGAPGLITVQGLTTGQVYTVSIYGVSFDPPAARASNFTNGTDSIYVNENASPPRDGLRVDYTFTATTTTNLTIIMPTNANTFHIYALALRKPLVVTTNSNAGPGSLRQAVLDAAALPGADTITFAPSLSGAIITLASEIVLNNNVAIDASSLPGGVTLSGGNVTRIFFTDSPAISLRGLTFTAGNGAGDPNSGNAGAILNSMATALDLNRCTFFGNIASTGDGGAIGSLGTLTMSQCTLSSNQTAGFGGAIESLGTLTLTHCTVAGNVGLVGGGIDSFSGTLTLENTIVAGNTAGNGADINNESSTFARTGTNLVQDIINVGTVTQFGPTPINAAPLLAALGNYGGPTQTMPPLPGSPALNAASVIAGLTTDQRGSARNVGGAPDIGAVESGGLWVQNANDSGANSLRAVVAGSSSVPDSKTILFVPSLSGATITLASEIVLGNNVAIDASSLTSGLTISGGPGTNRIFSVYAGVAAALSGLTMTGGNGGGEVNAPNGGAIYIDNGTLDVTRCTIIGNTGDYGGAIVNLGTLAMSQCLLASNSASGPGGAIYSQGPLTLINCTLVGNHAGNDGGGMETRNSTILSHCTITGNDADSVGGGVKTFDAGTVIIANCIVAGNSSGLGADILIDTSTLSFQGANINQSTLLFSGTMSGPSPINANPLLAPLGNYGGPTQTLPPLPGSPAINAAVASSLATDQRGYPRPVGLAADIGAVEGIYNAAGPGKITSLVRLTNGFVRLSFTNLTDAVFPVLASTNPSTPSSNWTQIGFAVESPVGSGQFPFTDPQAPNYSNRFYRVKSP